MPINKAMQAALSALPELDVKSTYRMERRLQKLMSHRPSEPSPCRVLDHGIPCGSRSIPVRIFAPEPPRRETLLLFFHGGGWVTGSVDSYNGVCRDMAALTGCTVSSVDYRLAPEHRFPAAPEDCYAAAREVFLNGGLPGAPTRDIVLIGDSAGGNLAAAVSLMARDRGEFLPARQILIYPALAADHTMGSPYPSVHENGSGRLLTSKRVQDFTELYRSSENDAENPYFAPMCAGDLRGQPDSLIITAEYCPLRDEGEAYGERLREAGSRVEIHRMPGAQHGYFSLPARFRAVKETYAIIDRFLEGAYER